MTFPRLSPALSTLLLALGLVGSLKAQLPQGLDLQALKQAAGAQGISSGSVDAVPGRNGTGATTSSAPEDAQKTKSEDERLERDIQALKRREKGPYRFASDLFQVRQRGTGSTEGGISEDYVLGTGDRLNLNVFGSATFDLPVQVDGRGEIVIPKVGTAKVGGLTLGKAKAAVQGLVSRNFSRSSVDLQVIKLREVRVFVLGEVYKPGSYLVSSLSSLVNVLSLAGGPTAVGSYRDIRVMRGGQKVYGLDLYPLRADGLGNANVALQHGDTVFVPLAQNQVLLEGAFARVVQAPVLDPEDEQLLLLDKRVDQDRDLLEREIRRLEFFLAQGLPQAPKEDAMGKAGESGEQTKNQNDWTGLMPKTVAPAQGSEKGKAINGAEPLPMEQRLAVEAKLGQLKRLLASLSITARGDHRIRKEPVVGQTLREENIPEWRRLWDLKGVAPRMQFEMKAGETTADALRYAGGLLPESASASLTLRKRGADGAFEAVDVPVAKAGSTPLGWGDVLSALPRRDSVSERSVTVAGWVRVPGLFACTNGLRVGDLLSRDAQLLPDTYQARGEIVRTHADGTTRFLSFDVAKALKGDAEHNLLLEGRDRVELYRLQDLRLPRTVKLLGPVTRPGLFEFHEGMRASDLIFRAGLPLKSANRLSAELARTKDGKSSEIIRLDLSRLLSTEAGSPVALHDDGANPVLQPDDQLSLFEKPDYRLHRTVRIIGQVARPGSYTMDTDKPTLAQLIQRAGGLTSEAMPKAGVFLRNLGGGSTPEVEDVQKQLEALKKYEERPQMPLGPGSGADGATSRNLAQQALDPTSKGANDILDRLNETRRQAATGQLLKGPLMHGLLSGALNRMVVDFGAALGGDSQADVELQDGDEIIIPRATDAAYVVGETASPFATYKVRKGMKVSDLLTLAGGTTRNADSSNIRLLKADGRILDSWVEGKAVEPGDTVLVPQRFRRDSSWQENLQALTPIAIVLSTLKL
ncbi:SLBB domain-containing protein [Geothrix sp. PMB-07]|uniref:polysaccharide biosynthesis/export family protein n=1 Tax=Geothrix sp. PMB-07 TaxID=3068640 RepID=UPI002740BE4C|nr:SLBB domain-containing protein [Geothrix sp. PMB-07]WLT31311.1 SLBB domain-containing protein [Geothrix sp. PMB-07]